MNSRAFSVVSWAWVASLVLAPLLYILAISFMPRGTYGGVATGFTTEHYARLGDPQVQAILSAVFGRSVLCALITTLACALVGYPLALYLVFRAGRWRESLFFLLIVPFWTNFLVRTYAWYALLADNGWINQALEAVGFGPQALSLLFTPQAIVLGMFYNYLPYMAMSLYVSLEKLDPLHLEAAADLGAGPWRRFAQVILPQSLPGLVAGGLLVFIPALGEFVIPDVLGGGTRMFVGGFLGQQFLVARNWPFGAAVTVLLLGIVGVCLFAFSRVSRRVAGGEILKEVLP